MHGFYEENEEFFGSVLNLHIKVCVKGFDER